MVRLDGPRLEPASGGPARHLVVLLHGYGSDGNDLIGLARCWHEAMPDTAFVAPHGPEPCELAPMGYQWFSLDDYDPDLARRDPARMAERYNRMVVAAERVAPAAAGFIDDELASLGLDRSRLALVGFSQGTMLSLHLALRHDRPCAAVLGYSGALLGADGLARAITARPPVLLCHGDADDVVPVNALFDAATALGQAEVAVQWHVCPGLGHGVDEPGLTIGARFLIDMLPR